MSFGNFNMKKVLGSVRTGSGRRLSEDSQTPILVADSDKKTEPIVTISEMEKPKKPGRAPILKSEKPDIQSITSNQERPGKKKGPETSPKLKADKQFRLATTILYKSMSNPSIQRRIPNDLSVVQLIRHLDQTDGTAGDMKSWTDVHLIIMQSNGDIEGENVKRWFLNVFPSAKLFLDRMRVITLGLTS